jgi:hypothetical protein
MPSCFPRPKLLLHAALPSNLPDDGDSKHLWNVVNFYQTTWRNDPEDSHLNTYLVLSLLLDQLPY